ncbi:MAG: tripartite tricarboxylate transporter substrate-binding protein, partial [Oscillibacter sp.]
GNRNSNHIGAQMLANSADFTYTDIPYGGTADQLLALRQSEVDFSVAKVADFASFPSEVKVLGAFNPERLVEYPDVPTLAELGLYDQWLGSSRCIAAPAGVSAEIVAFYADAFEKLMQDPDYLKAAEAAGINTDYQGPEATAKLVSDQQTFAESLDSVWGG